MAIGVPDLLVAALERLERGTRIADIGCGLGAAWWKLIPPGCTVDAYDLGASPDKLPRAVRFHQRDALTLATDPELAGAYQLVVADHVFEHVHQPADLAKAIGAILAPGGYLHAGVPDATNFTDRFYHLIHRDSGGHVSQYTRESFVQLLEQHGFAVEEILPWPDDWAWFERLFNLEHYGVQHFRQEDKTYMADVFRKELTPEKGYLYGWEFLFRRR